MLPAERGRQPRSEGPGTAATPIAASPVRQLADQALVHSTNQEGRWRAGAEERTKREASGTGRKGLMAQMAERGGAVRGNGGERRGWGRAGRDHVPAEQGGGNQEN